MVKVNAQELILSNEVIHFDKYKDFDLQGFTVTPNHIFAVLISDNENDTIIKIFDNKTFKEVKSIDGGSLGHANDVTYNSRTNEVYVIDNGNKTVHIFNGITFEYIGKKESEVSLRSLAYIKEKDCFIGRNVTSGYYLDKDLKLINKNPFIVGMNISRNVARQGWDYYDGKIYYATWSWIRLGGDGTNTIYVYQMNGDKVGEIKTEANVGEIEGISFLNDKMLLGFNGYNNYIAFYLEDIVELNKNTFNEINNEEANIKDDKKFNKIIVGIIIFFIFLILIGLFLTKYKRLKKI